MTHADPEIDALTSPETVSPAVSAALRLPIWLVVGGAVVAGTLLPVVLHSLLHEATGASVTAMSFFFCVNAMIAFWEIALFRHRDWIRERHASTATASRGRELQRVIGFFRKGIPASEILSTRTWAEVWSTYALFDDAYADRRSFGFMVDIGNGFTTLVPSLLIPWAIALQSVPPRILGIVVLILCYQMLYGTLLYFVSFVLAGRHRGHRPTDLLVFVGLSNAIWTVFPVWGIALGIWMIVQGSYGIFTG